MRLLGESCHWRFRATPRSDRWACEVLASCFQSVCWRPMASFLVAPTCAHHMKSSMHSTVLAAQCALLVFMLAKSKYG